MKVLRLAVQVTRLPGNKSGLKTKNRNLSGKRKNHQLQKLLSALTEALTGNDPEDVFETYVGRELRT